jgi:hypothetical protein
MNWIAAFFRWLFCMPRAQRLRAMAHACIAAILDDLATFPAGHLSPAEEQGFLISLARCLDTAHNCVSLHIHAQACQIAGRPLGDIRKPWVRPRDKAPTREVLLRRVAELLNRLERADDLARQRAVQLAAIPLRLAGCAGDPPPPAAQVEEMLASAAVLLLHRLWRGRWIAAPWPRDGGGGSSQPRAPP